MGECSACQHALEGMGNLGDPLGRFFAQSVERASNRYSGPRQVINSVSYQRDFVNQRHRTKDRRSAYVTNKRFSVDRFPGNWGSTGLWNRFLAAAWVWCTGPGMFGSSARWL